jgi:MFS family permease
VLLLSSIGLVMLSLVVLGVVNIFVPQFTIIPVVLYILFFAPGLGPVPWTISSEIFNAKVRGLGTSISSASNWGANFLISVTFPIFTSSIGLAYCMFGYCILAAGSFLFVYLLVPETKQKTLEEVQVMLRETPYPTKWCRNKRRLKI